MPKMNLTEKDQLRDACATWLADKEKWDVFYTLTFKSFVDTQGVPHPPGIQRLTTAWNNFGEQVCLFGARSIAVVERGTGTDHPPSEADWATKIAKTQGRLHIHGLYSGPEWIFNIGLQYWQLKYGFTNHTKVKDTVSCAKYLSKYMFKGVDIELLDFGYMHGIHSLQSSFPDL